MYSSLEDLKPMLKLNYTMGKYMYGYEFSSNLIHTLKSLLKQNVSKSLPGFLEILDVYCMIRYNKDFCSLFLESPCELYKSLQDLYKDASTTEITFRLLLKSIIADDTVVNILLNYVKTCSDKEFLETIHKIVSIK
ncbi:MAG: hypothetical protein QXV06_04410 [Ignisphaera sp.]